MGLIKAAVGAIGGTLADSWKEAIHCEKMDNATILRMGTLVGADSKRNQNKKGSENFITNGSVIIVEENTCMLTIDNGKITNVVAEPGEYTFSSMSAPSIFSGNLGDAVDEVIKRFTFGGVASSEQKVVYINLQPLPGIPFGTSTPMPYPDPRYNTTVDLRFYGTFEIEIENAEMAVRFYQEVASKGVGSGSISAVDIFKSMQYKNEFMQAMMEALNALSAEGVSYNQIAMNMSKLTEKVSACTQDNWKQRGFTITNIGMGPVTISDESKELLKDRQKADTMLGSDVQKAMMTGSIARSTENAAKNSAGAAIGFMNMNTATNVGGNIIRQMDAAQRNEEKMQAQQQPQNTSPKNTWVCGECGKENDSKFCIGCGAKKPSDGWKCSCGETNTGKFCTECGKPMPQENDWTCSCGKKNSGKFCSECGKAAPEKKSYKCSKCGYTPENDATLKFCPECGKSFDDSDLV